MGALQRSVGAERYESGRTGGRAWRAEKHQSERSKGVPPCRIDQQWPATVQECGVQRRRAVVSLLPTEDVLQRDVKLRWKAGAGVPAGEPDEQGARALQSRLLHRTSSFRVARPFAKSQL